MLKEISVNKPGLGETAGRFAQKQGTSIAQSVLQAASAQRLPSDDSEEDLEDFSSGPEDDERPSGLQAAPLRRLQRGAAATSQTADRKAVQESELDDVLDGIAALGLEKNRTEAQRLSPASPEQSDSLPSTAASWRSGRNRQEDGSDNDDDDADDDADQPFYERKVPPIIAPAAASQRQGLEMPQAGSLVLGDRGQYVLAETIASKLYPHQVKGVTWLWSLYEKQRGGILGDDMGLGKTMQCAAFLAGLFGSGLAKRAIIIAPKTLIPHWIKELGTCGLGNRTREYLNSSESERADTLRRMSISGGILVTTYGMVQHNASALARGSAWDVMLLDEGHKIKNPKMKLVEHLRSLPVRIRIIISGTPIQNNLMEMHALFDFTAEGLLGDSKTFRQNYEKPITKGLDKGATAWERKTGAAIAAELRSRIDPYFLRREKKDVLLDKKSGSSNSDGATSTCGASSSEVGQPAKGLPRKFDLVVWVRLTDLQRKIYVAFLHTDDVRMVLNEKASPLASITVLKKICDHPALLTQAAAESTIRGAHRWAKGPKASRPNAHGYDSDFIDDSEEESSEDADECDRRRAVQQHADDAPLKWLGDASALDGQLSREVERRGADASCKTVFVLALLKRLHAEGHRTLIFSQSKVMLNILEAGVKAMNLAFCRIDGDVSTAEERQAQVERFQRSSSIPVFLLTSQVGGLGLTLTAADRVIILDPHWNPSVDNQSVDRAYRLGQTRDVVIYRLITCGTVEEKIYRKQVFKGGLSKTGTEEGIQFRYFTQTDLRDLFAVSEEGLQQSATQVQLHAMHAHQRNATEELERHLEALLGMEGVAGIHDHNLLFTQRPDEPVPTAQEGAAILSQMSEAGLIGVDALADKLTSSMQLVDNKRQAAIQQAQHKVTDLTNRLRRMLDNIAHPPVKLPDGGAKLKECARQLEKELEAAKAEYKALTGGEAGGSDGASTSSGGDRTATEPLARTGGLHASAGPSGSRGDGVRDSRTEGLQSGDLVYKPPMALLGLKPPGRSGGFGSGPAFRAAAAAATSSVSSEAGDGGRTTSDVTSGRHASAPGSDGASHPSARAAMAAGAGGRTGQGPELLISDSEEEVEAEEDLSFYTAGTDASPAPTDTAATRRRVSCVSDNEVVDLTTP